MIKLVFLDIDGVLNCFGAYDWGERPKALILPECVQQFNRIIEATEAQIVLSSSWRHVVLNGHMDLCGFEYLLRSHGVRGSLVDVTPAECEDGDRGIEITMWLQAHPGIKRYVVIDDMQYDIPQYGHSLVQTHGNVGLTAGDAQRAIEILNRE
jgi:hypothetical protein